jgi:hypothetical protein
MNNRYHPHGILRIKAESVARERTRPVSDTSVAPHRQSAQQSHITHRYGGDGDYIWFGIVSDTIPEWDEQEQRVGGRKGRK